MQQATPSCWFSIAELQVITGKDIKSFKFCLPPIYGNDLNQSLLNLKYLSAGNYHRSYLQEHILAYICFYRSKPSPSKDHLVLLILRDLYPREKISCKCSLLLTPLKNKVYLQCPPSPPGQPTNPVIDKVIKAPDCN